MIIAGTWKVEPGRNKVSGPSGRVQLEPKVMDVLVYLCENRNRVVTKEELIEQVWNNQVVTDNTITQAVSKIRKIFGDDPAHPEYIDTIPKKGYQFIAEVMRDKTPEKTNVQHGGLWNRVQQYLSRSIPIGIGVLFIVIILITVISLSLFKNDVTGSSAKSIPVTTLHGMESDPALSPDGNKVAYAWLNPQTGLQNIFIKIIDDPSSELQITESNGQDSSPAWSPDGNRIAFIRHSGNECWFYMVSSIGGRPGKLVSCGNNSYPDLTWSPDNRWLAYNDQTENGSFGIVLVNADIGEKRYITHPPAKYWGDYDPVFSPDGSQLAFTRAFSEGVQDIFIIGLNRDSDDPERLTHDSRNIFGLAWLDADQLVFSSNRGGTYDLWSISINSGNIREYYTGNRHLVNPDFHANGRLIYESRYYDMNIRDYSFSLGPDKTRTSSPFINSTRWELYPSLSPNEQQIAFITNRSGNYELWISSADGTGAGQLTDFEGPFVSNPDWSPDNRTIVFDARPGGHGDIYRIDAGGGEPVPIINDPANDLVPRWSRDGKWIYFASDRTGDWQIWKTTSGGKNTEQVTTNGGFAARESRDGRLLYYSKINEPGIWFQSKDQTSETKVVDRLDPGDWGNWQVGGQGIYFVNRTNPGFPVISLKKSNSDSLFTILEPNHAIPTHDAAFTVTRDGTRILLGKSGRRDSDLMMINKKK